MLSNGYKFDVDMDGTVQLRPCCMFNEQKAQPLDTDTDAHQRYRTYLNSLDSHRAAECQTCNYINKKDLRPSWRDYSFKIVPDSAELGDASYVELQLDRVCNGGCIMCSPKHSSFWATELRQVPIKPPIDHLSKVMSLVDVQKTKRLMFLGGEPFLSNADEKVLAEIKRPELVDLQYTTNGSIYPSQERIALWKKFKSVLINISVDGVGARFEYIRYPLKWAKITENLDRMLKYMPENVSFKVNHTVNLFSLFYHNEFDAWYRQVGMNPRIKTCTFNPAIGVLSPQKVPQALLTLIDAHYPKASPVRKAILGTDPCVSAQMYLKEIDQRRGLDWRQVFPDIADCFSLIDHQSQL